ncbi:MAG: hypothetical protein JO331_14685 [Verrucomicrobia bacterium]|nr:hypothetical protein [Verrucomicrobiota bacterium]
MWKFAIAHDLILVTKDEDFPVRNGRRAGYAKSRR